MKNSTYKNIFLISMIIAAAWNSQAQQKASDRSFGSEIKKVKDIQQARKKILRETQQPSTRKETEATIPTEKTKQSPATKPSLQPMIAPVKPKKQ